MKKTVVSFADGSGNYAKALLRLEQSLRQVNFEGQTVFTDGSFVPLARFNLVNNKLVMICIFKCTQLMVTC